MIRRWSTSAEQRWSTSAERRGRPYLPPAPVVPSAVWVGDQAILFVEGPIKALALCQFGLVAVALGGVTAGGHDVEQRGPFGEMLAHEDLRSRLRLEGRRVVILFDAGRVTNPMVAVGEARLAKVLRREGADVRLAELPLTDDKGDQGPDDYLARHGADALRELLAQAVPASPAARVAHATEGLSRPARGHACMPFVGSLPFRAALVESDDAELDLAMLALRDAGFRTTTTRKEMTSFAALLREKSRQREAKPSTPTAYATEYRLLDGGIVHVVSSGDLESLHRLSNFTAEIVAEVVHTDGATEVRHYEIAARLDGRTMHFSVLASAFARLLWVGEYLGAAAIVEPGRRNQDHVSVAIQKLSSRPQLKTVYAHLGWREIDNVPYFLHAKGGSGEFIRSDISVSLPGALNRFELPPAPSGPALHVAIRASLAILDVAPVHASAAVLSAAYAPVIGLPEVARHGVFVCGSTGAGKTELAALAQQHYGAGLDAANLPAAWSSTENALEGLAFIAKDALLVIDDFCPRGGRGEVDALHAKADRVFRAQGNRSGRARMRADGSMLPTRPPRGMILATGEDVPEGQSLRARLLIAELGRSELDWGALGELQVAAREGVLASALAGFIAWIASDLTGYQARVRARSVEFAAAVPPQHRRSARSFGSAGAALELLLDFALSADAIDVSERTRQWTRCWGGLLDLAERQVRYLRDEDPAQLFVTLVRAAMRCGRAHVTTPDGHQPRPGEPWGWRDGLPQGTAIGVLDHDNLLVEPAAATAVVRRLASEQGTPIALGPRSLHARLREGGHLATDGGERGALVRRTFHNVRSEYLHLHVDTADPEPEQGQFGPGRPTQGSAES